MTTAASAAPGVPDQVKLRWLTADDWRDLREIRLAALADSPSFFLGRYEDEASRGELWWRRKCSHGNWVLAYRGAEPVGMMGVTRCKDIPRNGRYIESLWIVPDYRRAGLASDFTCQMMQELARRGVGSIWLWVLDGNDAARSFYKKLGFVHNRGPVELGAKYPGRWETRLTLSLSSLPSDSPVRRKSS